MKKFDLIDCLELTPTYKLLFEKKTVIDGFRSLPMVAVREIQESLSMKWTYNSNSIEGKSLSLRETHIVI